MKWYAFSPLVLQKLIWVPTRFILFFFGRMEVKGMEHLEHIGRTAIFACNHASELDPFFVPAVLPFFSRFSPIFYTSREKAFYDESGWRQHFYGGVFFKAWGAYPVITGLHDYEKSLVNHVRIVSEGGSVCVFPEGGRTHDGQIHEAKGGVAYLACVTKVPIVPVRIDGSWRVSIKDLLLRRRKLAISFGQPLFVAERNGTIPSVDELKIHANQVMDRIRAMDPAKKPEPMHEPVSVVVPSEEELYTGLDERGSNRKY